MTYLLAQIVPPPVVVSQPQSTLQLVLQAFIYGCMLMLALLPMVVALVQRMKPGAKKDAMLVAAAHAEAIVMDLMKEARAMQDPSQPGDWNEATQAALKQKAIDALLRVASHEIERTLDNPTPALVQQQAATLVEAQVQRARVASAPAAPAVPPAPAA